MSENKKSGKASLKAVTCTPRKARLLRGLIKDQEVSLALARLGVQNRAGASVVAKLIRSAIAQVSVGPGEGLIVQDLEVNEGPKRRYFMPRAQGRASPVLKRTSHITVRLAAVEGE